jgi:recombination protein RecR
VSLQGLIRQLNRLPGVGIRSAERLALALLKWDPEQIAGMADLLVRVRNNVHPCSRCFMMTDRELCAVCEAPNRETGTICVVASFRELAAIERSGEYRGLYHVIGGHLSPLEGIGPADLKVGELLARIQEEGTREIILALTPNDTGEATTHWLRDLLEGRGVRVSRIARGIPSGADLEYADERTIAGAIQRREVLD